MNPGTPANTLAGGNSFQLWGFGAKPTYGSPGVSGTGYGSGGGAAHNGPFSGVAGGSGTGGYVIVEEFY
jgi:hypothetical protein